MSENVLRIKLEGSDESAPATPTPPPKDIRHNPTLEDLFGAPATSPTDDMAAAARRKAIIAAADSTKEAANAAGKKVAEAVRAVRSGKSPDSPPDDPDDPNEHFPRFRRGRRLPRNVMSFSESQQLAEEQRQKVNQERHARMLSAGIATQNLLGDGGTGQKAAGAVQLASTGVFGARAAALAGGPVGGAVMVAGIVADLAEKKITESFQSARDEITSMGKAAQQAAGNDALGMLATNANRAADKIEKNGGIFGKIIAEELRTVTTAVETFKSTVQAFTARGEELKSYDPRIAQASAEAELRRIQGDIREADRMGERYARLLEKSSQTDQQLRELILPIKEILVELLTNILSAIQTLTDFDKLGAFIVKTMLEVISRTPLLGLLLRMVVNVEDAKKQIDEELKKKEDERAREAEANGKKILDDWFASANAINLGENKTDPFINAADRALKIPAFGY